MLKSLSFFIKYFVCWCIFFLINRLCFELAFYQKLSELSFSDIYPSYLYGLHMDASMTGYLCILPFLYYGIAFLFPKIELSLKPIKVYTIFFVIITAIITISDINIYREWGTKLNYRALEFLFQSPSEALASTASSPVLLIIIGLIILVLIGIVLFKNLVFTNNLRDSKPISWYLKVPVYLFVLGLTFLAIRGGTGVAPMNTSKAYYSEHQVLNFAAINTNWFLMSNIIDHQKTSTNPYVYYNKKDLNDKFSQLQLKPDSLNINILNTKKPNIVLIIMESFTADLVEELGGESGVTPNFSKLIKEGLLFNNIYSASDRTDKGILAVISSFPAQATRSIIKENDKQDKLPSLANVLTDNGYSTSFFYGGDTDFSNFKSYILSHGYQTLYDKNNFKTEEIKSNWGAYDNITLEKQRAFLEKRKKPFFSTLLTLTNHEPFQLPVKGKFGDATVENKFRSTSYYVDDALGEYIQNVKKESWYQNTLFIVTADHGHRLPKNIHEAYDPGKYHIPLLIFGGALSEEFKGKKIEKFGNQVDIAYTLLKQLNLPANQFKYGKDLLNPSTKGYSFYNWDNGFGLIDKDGAVSFDPISNKVIFKSEGLSINQAKKHLENAKTLMQEVFTDYMAY